MKAEVVKRKGLEHRAGAQQYGSENEEDEEADLGWAGLPDALNRVVVEGSVARDDRDVFNLRLRDEKPVEGVSVVEGKIGYTL